MVAVWVLDPLLCTESPTVATLPVDWHLVTLTSKPLPDDGQKKYARKPMMATATTARTHLPPDPDRWTGGGWYRECSCWAWCDGCQPSPVPVGSACWVGCAQAGRVGSGR